MRSIGGAGASAWARRRGAVALAAAALAAVAAAPRAARAQDQGGSQDDRLKRLEQKVADQQRELDALKHARPDAATGTAGAEPRGMTPEEEQRRSRAVVGSETPQGFGPGLEWGYKEGFFLKGEAGGYPYEIRPRARIQTDFRGFDDNSNARDQFILRRMRVGFDGSFSVFKYDFEVDPIRGQSNTTAGAARPLIPLGDFWVQYAGADAANVRAGHYKTPWSLEDGITSDLYIDTVERSMIVGSGTSLAPDFHPGIELLGKVGGDGTSAPSFKYWVNYQNENDSQAAAQWGDDGIIATRGEVDVAGFGIGGAGLWVREGDIGHVARSPQGVTPGQFAWFAPLEVHGWTQRYEVDASYNLGPFWTQGEYAWSRQDRYNVTASGADGAALIMQGFYAELGYKFWGPAGDSPGPHAPLQDWELFSSRVVKVRNGRNVGMEAVCKLEWMDCDDASGGHGAPGGAANSANFPRNGAKAITTGVNFWPIENVKLMADWDHVQFDHEITPERKHGRKDADEFLVRWQLEF